MIRSGLRPNKHDHRDYDFIKTKLGGLAPAVYPDNYSVDVGLWVPNQELPQTFPTFSVPALPEGCTDYAQTDLCVDEDRQLYNPMDIENITHANANGGTDLRTSLNAVIYLRKTQHPTYFAIKPTNYIDWFDAVRLAMIVGRPEGRAVSVGTPWFPEFMVYGQGIVGTPSWNLTLASWHNWVVCGWKTINGQVYLVGKPWCGTQFGDNGFCYFSRDIFNHLMQVNGTAAYTLDKLLPGETPQTVDSTTTQWITSFLRYIILTPLYQLMLKLNP